MKITLSIVSLISLLLFSAYVPAQDELLSSRQAKAEQDSASQIQQLSEAAKIPLGMERASNARSLFSYSLGVNSEQRALDKKVTEAARELRQAKSTDERSAAEDSLSNLLEEDYDARLDGYEEYLDSLESKLKEMRAALEKRRDAKSEMIKLRIKVLEAEAEDLGWPKRMSSSSLFRLKTDDGEKAMWNKLSK